MDIKERANTIVNLLEAEYPSAHCSLQYSDALQLLIATRLSAQCTDERVNIVTPVLFGKYPDVHAFAEADITDVENIIHSCGLYKTKAKDIVGICRMIVSDFGGKVPDSMEKLLHLPGVGRKTANLIVGDIFGRPSIVADTHCIRLSNRLGLVQSTDPYKVEIRLKEIIPAEKSGMFCHRLVWHGRAVCNARNPKCASCVLNRYCDYIKEIKKS